jgi:hypothetical protein
MGWFYSVELYASIVYWGETAVTKWCSVCLYFSAAVVVLCARGLQHFQMQYMPTWYLYTVSAMAAAVEYWKWYPHCRVSYHFMFPDRYRTLRQTGSFPWGNAEREQQWHGEDGVVKSMQHSSHSNVHKVSMMTDVAHICLSSISPAKNTTPLTETSRTLCAML